MGCGIVVGRAVDLAEELDVGSAKGAAAGWMEELGECGVGGWCLAKATKAAAAMEVAWALAEAMGEAVAWGVVAAEAAEVLAVRNHAAAVETSRASAT